jgi:hypothetical protein
MINSTIKVTGKLIIEVIDCNDIIKSVVEVKNLVVDVGLNQILERFKEDLIAAPTHMAIGSGVVAAAAGDTSLGSELARSSLLSSSVSGSTITYKAGFASGVGTGNISEAGIFNSASNGIMLCRTVFDQITKSDSDAIKITWNIALAN